MENRNDLRLIAALVFFALCTAWLGEAARNAEAHTLLAPPPEHIEYFHFGFKESVADSFWLRWIQDADTCYAYKSPVRMLRDVKDVKDLEEKRRQDPLYNPRHKVCDNSWGFKMLDTVTKLDPKFTMPYLAGAMALSVLVEDYEGASVIFERGLKAYPDDWQLAYRAAYHFLFDRRDYARAAQLLTHAADLGGPSWFRSLAARLYSKTGQLELGLATLLTYRKTFSEGDKSTAELDKRIAELKAELEKERGSSATPQNH